MDPLRVKLYILFKGLIPIYYIGLVNGVYPRPYEVFYYNINIFYKERRWGHSFRLNKLSILYIKL